MASFLICERRLRDDDPSLARAMAVAHLRHERPRCLCTPDGIEMYVAKAGHGFVLKRMPYTGLRHAALCRSHGSPNAYRRTRSRENRTGSTTPHVERSDLIGAESRLLRNFVTSLWHRAELTRWQPGFEGKRSWATVRRHLLAAAAKVGRATLLTSKRLYIPEVFRLADRESIRDRRLASCDPARESVAREGLPLILIGELKRLSPARRHFEATIKHIPDEAFEIDDNLYRWISDNLLGELELWGARVDVRLIVAASFSVQATGRPRVQCLTLLPVSLEWLPVRDVGDLLRTEKLVRERRTFVVAPQDAGDSRPLNNRVLGASPATAPVPAIARGCSTG
jgi:hypothetical protein